MPTDVPTLLASRRHQIFPRLEQADIARVHRFGRRLTQSAGELIECIESAGRPAPLESSVAGVFAVGDVRSGSVEGVGGAIGEGAAAVAQIHQYPAGWSQSNALNRN